MGRLQIIMLWFCLITEFSCAQKNHADWPQWRGPTGTGVSPHGNPPTEWSETKNVRWKTRLPGRGHSTPVVAGDRVYVTAAIPIGEKLAPKKSGRPGAHDNLEVDSRHSFEVLAIDRSTGEISWQKRVHDAIPHEGGHYTASLASASPATDGKHIFAFFGSYGLYCLDQDGNIRWQKSFPPMHSKHGHGEGSSPALYDSTLVVNWDHEEQSFVAAIDTANGNEIWRKDREEVTSWSSPIIVEHDGAAQVIVCGTQRVRAYDLSNGDIIWQCGGLSANVVATPVYANGMVYVGSSYEKRALMAISIDQAKGDITDTDHVVWMKTRGTPYVPSPLLYDGALYYLTHYQNVLTRIEAKTGEDSPGAFRMGPLGNIYASPVGAGGNVYVTDLEGTTLVITNKAIPRPISVNRVGESISASVAIAGNELFLRGDRHLFCIAKDESDEDQ